MSRKTWFVENSWSCDSCGSTTQKGRHLKCAKCGAPKGKGVVDRIPDPDSAPAVANTDRLRQARAGANWVCEYCGKQERTINGKCKYCAGEREREAERVNISQRRTGGLRYDPKQTLEGHNDDVAARSKVSVRPKGWWGHRRNQLKVAAGVMAAMMFAGFMYWLFVPREVNTEITHIEWKYTKQLQERETLHGESWDYQRPSSHFNDRCERRQNGTEDCNAHDCNPHQESYSCNAHDCSCSNQCTDQGNGYSSCTQVCSTCYDTCYRTEYDTCYDQCAVYDDWCSYDYYNWKILETKESVGSNNHDMSWPDLETTKELQRIKSWQKFKVDFSSSEEHKYWDINPESAAEFKKYVTGDYWVIEVNRAGRVKPLHKITAEEM